MKNSCNPVRSRSVPFCTTYVDKAHFFSVQGCIIEALNMKLPGILSMHDEEAYGTRK